jgi:hypothetical protein
VSDQESGLRERLKIARLLPPASSPVTGPASNRSPAAANDDQWSWNLVPFPDGWNAAC